MASQFKGIVKVEPSQLEELIETGFIVVDGITHIYEPYNFLYVTDDDGVDGVLSSTSINPVQNKVITTKINEIESNILTTTTALDLKANVENTIKIARNQTTESTSDIVAYTEYDGAAICYVYPNTNETFNINFVGSQIKQFSNGYGFGYQCYTTDPDGSSKYGTIRRPYDTELLKVQKLYESVLHSVSGKRITMTPMAIDVSTLEDFYLNIEFDFVGGTLGSLWGDRPGWALEFLTSCKDVYDALDENGNVTDPLKHAKGWDNTNWFSCRAAGLGYAINSYPNHLDISLIGDGESFDSTAKNYITYFVTPSWSPVKPTDITTTEGIAAFKENIRDAFALGTCNIKMQYNASTHNLIGVVDQTSKTQEFYGHTLSYKFSFTQPKMHKFDENGGMVKDEQGIGERLDTYANSLGIRLGFYTPDNGRQTTTSTMTLKSVKLNGECLYFNVDKYNSLI